MPTINVQPRDMQDGTRITYFNDTVSTTSTTYTFNAAQEMVWLRNRGSKDLNYTAGAFSGTLGKSEFVRLVGNFTSIVLSSSQGTQAFELISDEVGTVGSSPEAVSSLGQQVSSLSSSLAGVVKSVNGTTPDANGNVTVSGGGSGIAIVYNTLAELQAAYPSGVAGSFWVESDKAYYTWNGAITPPADTTAPTLTVTAGGTFTGTKSVTMSTNETATIYYTLDGSTPTTSSSVYSSTLSISATTTLKAFAKDTAGNSSAVQTVTYTLDTTPDTTAPVLTITPAANFTTTQNVVMSATDASSYTIWYTVDNSDPTSSGTRVQYTTPVTLSATTTVKAYAVDSANNASAVQTVTYTKQASTTYANATFSGGDNASSLGTLDSGQSWIVDGVWGVSAGEARVYTAGTTFTSAVVDAGVSDNISIEAKFAKANTNMALVFRFTDFNNYFYLNTTATGFILTRRVGGTSTNIKTITTTAPVSGDVVSVELSGSNIVTKINGTIVDTTVDSANATATKHGLNTTVSTSRSFDNFVIKSL